ncbi:MAG: TetR/AcrR family transcriptional regulator [Solirubrobacteraceae bacterium]|nr:TetR/AcrR family transcriptional regulator [Solirubrobacteraceae bacterium]
MTGRPRGEHPSRDELVQAALRCFLRNGYESTTVKQVAEEAGTSVGQLYLSFANKYAMFVAVHAYGNRILREQYIIPGLTRETASPWERVMALLDGYMNFYLEQRGLATLMALTSLDDAVADDPVVQEMFDEQKANLDQTIALVTELTKEVGSDLDPGHVVRWCWAATYGLAATNIRLPHMAVDDDELDQIVRTGLRLTRAGLRDAANRAGD